MFDLEFRLANRPGALAQLGEAMGSIAAVLVSQVPESCDTSRNRTPRCGWRQASNPRITVCKEEAARMVMRGRLRSSEEAFALPPAGALGLFSSRFGGWVDRAGGNDRLDRRLFGFCLPA